MLGDYLKTRLTGYWDLGGRVFAFGRFLLGGLLLGGLLRVLLLRLFLAARISQISLLVGFKVSLVPAGSAQPETRRGDFLFQC